MNSLLASAIQRVIPPCETNNRIGRFLQKIRRRSFRIFYSSKSGYFSQAGQDRFLNERIFRGKRGGTFIEIGAAEGILFSNTYFFEKDLEWSGVCVEPLPEAFSKLTAVRKCRCVQACVTDFSGAGIFFAVEKEVGASGSHTHELQVHCCTFSELMKENGIKQVDYLSIDTEGGELDLLRTIDFERFSIAVVSVENNFSDGRFEVIMTSNGYDLTAVIGDDDIYLRREECAAHRRS
jgi:FkbM family methyltransferase